MNAVVILRALLAMTARAIHLRELLGMRELLESGEVLVAIHALERTVHGVGEDLRVDGDRGAILALGIAVAVTGETVVVAGRLHGLRLGTRGDRKPQKDEGRQ